jgi:hypothetical protein
VAVGDDPLDAAAGDLEQRCEIGIEMTINVTHRLVLPSSRMARGNALH